MLYRILKFIFSYAIRKYFVRLTVLNKERIPLDKPVILLPNHRSAFMDPIVIAANIDRKTHFLTRGESFTRPVLVKIFNSLGMIPIYRKEHNPDKVDQNKNIFRHCFRLMEDKGCLMIFPEGICQTKYLLAPLKTGAARIALEAEDKNNFELDIHLIPVGINYSNPHRFRGNVTLTVGEPIRTKDYQNAYQSDAWKTTDDVTSEIDKGLRDCIITVEDQEQVQMVQQIERYVSFHPVKGSEDWFVSWQTINKFLNRIYAEIPNAYEELRFRLTHYVGSLNRLGLTGSNSLIDLSKRDLQNLIIARGAFLILGFPLFLVGFVLHILPFYLTRKLSLTVVKRVDFMGSVVLALGVLLFSISAIVETWLVWKYSQNILITILFFLVLPSLGLFAYHYSSRWVRWRESVKLRRVRKSRKRIIQQLMLDRSEIESLLQSGLDQIKGS